MFFLLPSLPFSTVWQSLCADLPGQRLLLRTARAQPTKNSLHSSVLSVSRTRLFGPSEFPRLAAPSKANLSHGNSLIYHFLHAIKLSQIQIVTHTTSAAKLEFHFYGVGLGHPPGIKHTLLHVLARTRHSLLAINWHFRNSASVI